MDCHQNARLTPRGRAALVEAVEAGLTAKRDAARFAVSAKTVAKWVRRYCDQGLPGLRDRSSRPHRLRRPTPPGTVALVEALRRERWTGQRIARHTGLSRATVSRLASTAAVGRARRPPAAPIHAGKNSLFVGNPRGEVGGGHGRQVHEQLGEVALVPTG
jgi:transposase